MPVVKSLLLCENEPGGYLVTHKKPRKAPKLQPDLNIAAAGLLYDMAALQPTERSQFGYKRAARTIVALPISVADAVSSGTLRDIPFIGPSSARVIAEFVETGGSSTVDAAIPAGSLSRGG